MRPWQTPLFPFQRENSETYQAPKALIRGTLFPGLDLPFMGLVNRTEKNTPLGELMALGFAMHELGLYLDTHQNDAEGHQTVPGSIPISMSRGRRTYEAKYGPLQQSDGVSDGKYVWLQDPWPWDYVKDGGTK